MSFPRYPKYKASGVEWIGDLPEGWEVRKVNQMFRAGKGKNGQMLTREFCGANQGDYPVYSGQTENEGVMGTWDQFEFDFGESGVLFSTTVGAKAMNLRQLFGRFSLSQNCMIIWTTSTRCVTRFFYYHFQPLFQWQRSMIPDHMQPSFRMEDLYACAMALPPLPEQTAIAEFLDRETGKIDELVAEQRRLMELLKEKRQAVISHAVTKGLNPHAPMKPSGIEWLDDIPKHWRVVSFKNLAKAGAKTFTDGDWIETPYIATEGVRLLQTGNVGIGSFKEQGFRFVSEKTFNELSCTEVKPNDVLICRLDGPVGRACLAPDLGVRMITSVDNAILKVADDVLPEFVVYLLSSVPWISWIDALCRVGGGFRLRISRSQLGEIRVPLPPLQEQIQIRERLNTLGNEFDTLTAEAQRAIDLLQERRTALISAAVTGQIDVRDAGGAAR